MKITDAFRHCSQGIDFVALDLEPSVVCGITVTGAIEYVNDAWWRFARANGARWEEGQWGLGASVLDVTPPPLRPFYESLYARTSQRGVPMVHFYDCSSAELKRQFGVRLHPLAEGRLLLVHALVAELPHGEEGLGWFEPRYRQAWGPVVQCAHCRRVQRVGAAAHWDWVPELVRVPRLPVSHGLCQPCFEYHYRQPPEASPGSGFFL